MLKTNGYFKFRAEMKNKSVHRISYLLQIDESELLDCTGIDTPYKLHKKIQAVFKFSEYYGKNWHAFEDFIDISEVRVIKIINIGKMREAIPHDTECFLKIIKRNMPKNCKLIFE